MSVEPTSQVAPWELLGALSCCVIGVLQGLPIADDRPRIVERRRGQTQVLLLLLLVAPGLAGAVTLDALIERRAWVSQPRDP